MTASTPQVNTERIDESRMAQVGTMALQLVHEVRTPLSAIRMNAQLVSEKMGALPVDVIEPFKKPLERMNTEVDFLGRMLTEFLTVARPPQFEPTVVDLNAFLREFSVFAAPDLLAHGTRLQLDLCEDALGVTLDTNQFTHALLNLVRNAVDAIEERRQAGAKVDDPHIRITTHRLGRNALLGVQDNGTGIAPESRERIFETFFTTKKSGTGLGLGFVKQVVQDHRGDIRLRHHGRPGAKFMIRLPLGQFLEWTSA